MRPIRHILLVLLAAIFCSGFAAVSLAEEVYDEEKHPLRYTGIRWAIYFGSYEGVERFALQELQRMVQQYQPYVIGVLSAPDKLSEHEDHLILLGTRAKNPLIDELVRKKQITLPEKPEGYTIACMDSPWNPQRRILVIAGTDASGVLYGVEDFNARVLSTKARLSIEGYTIEQRRKVFDALDDFTISESPMIENRGIWTWGYVIYDYRRFLDNMARLKMNMLIMWNDRPPLNSREIIAHAHSRGIKIVFGFHWGWGLGKGFSIYQPEGRQNIKKLVLRNYDKYYRGLEFDGIYFQTQTEHRDVEKGGQSTAEVVCKMVNEIGSEFLEAEPALKIYCGLHATSIREYYTDFKALDPRIAIMWEDAGVLPFSYTPSPYKSELRASYKRKLGEKGLEGAGETLEYSKKLATFRENSDFAMIAKGWTTLNWGSEFEHHGPFILGERSPVFIRNRLRKRQSTWDYVNTQWLKHYRVAVRFYREILDCSPRETTVVSLVEDGMFEEKIQHSMVLFAESVWNPRRDAEEILQLSLSPYYRMW